MFEKILLGSMFAVVASGYLVSISFINSNMQRSALASHRFTHLCADGRCNNPVIREIIGTDLEVIKEADVAFSFPI